jgi:hypothetical protein
MTDNHDYEELRAFLRADGQSDAQIEKILVRVRQYEAETQADSIMDSIGNGTLDLASLIQEALGDDR